MRRRGYVTLAFVLALAVTSGCRLSGGSAAASSSPSAPASAGAALPSPSPNDRLSPAVPMPAGFPADVPVYPGSRLTAAGAFTSSGITAFGMEWETLDSVTKVQAFFAAKLNQGDWTITFTGNANGAFSATFARKSNSSVNGLVGGDGSSGVTKISMSLAVPSS